MSDDAARAQFSPPPVDARSPREPTGEEISQEEYYSAYVHRAANRVCPSCGKYFVKREDETSASQCATCDAKPMPSSLDADDVSGERRRENKVLLMCPMWCVRNVVVDASTNENDDGCADARSSSRSRSRATRSPDVVRLLTLSVIIRAVTRC